jgi:hypothetical protein
MNAMSRPAVRRFDGSYLPENICIEAPGLPDIHVEIWGGRHRAPLSVKIIRDDAHCGASLNFNIEQTRQLRDALTTLLDGAAAMPMAGSVVR